MTVKISVKDSENSHSKAHEVSGIDAYAAAYPVSGEEVIRDNNCNGCDLVRTLDFAAADSYASGAVSTEWTSGGGAGPSAAKTATASG